MQNPMEIVFIPLDSRPCCCSFPQKLAAIAGHRLITPPAQLLGDLHTKASPTALLDWLERALEQAHQPTCLVSLDMLAWGGLVGSRTPQAGPDWGLVQLQRFLRLTAKHRVLAFSTVMRLRPTQTNPADQEWIENYARWLEQADPSWLETNGLAINKAIGQDCPDVPREQLFKQLVFRQLKHQTNLQILELMLTELTSDGSQPANSFLLYGMDDSRTKGLNVLEAGQLAQKLHRLKANSLVTPGTDELAMLLLARLAAPNGRFSVVWSTPQDAQRQTLYEDRCLKAVIQAQAQAAGATIDWGCQVEKPGKLLFVFAPEREIQGEAAAQQPWSGEAQRAASFVAAIEAALAQGSQVSVADVAWANGGSGQLAEALAEANLAERLTSYSGWNTAGNTLGTAIAALLIIPAKTTAHQDQLRTAFTLERWADDYLYQSKLRQQYAAEYGPAYKPLASGLGQLAANTLAQDIAANLDNYWQKHLANYQIGQVTASWPWQRLFEIDVNIDLTEKA